MPFTELAGFPTAKQQYDNSCWACSCRMIIEHYESVSFSSDKEFAEHVEMAPANSQKSAVSALEKMGYQDLVLDGGAIPTMAEIKSQIDAGNCFLAFMNKTKPRNNANLRNGRDGHWIVIIGYRESTDQILIFDPDTGTKVEASRTGKYGWGYIRSSTYVDKKPRNYTFCTIL